MSSFAFFPCRIAIPIGSPNLDNMGTLKRTF